MPFPLAAAAILGGASVVQGIAGFLSSKKQAKQAQAAQDQANSAVAQRAQQLDALLAEVSEEDKARIAKMTDAYSQIAVIQEQAYKDGKKEIGDQFEAMKGLLQANIQTEMAVVGKNATELMTGLNDFAKQASALVESDIESQKRLREAYKTDTAKIIPTMKRALDYSTQRADEIQRRGGLTPEASATISKAAEGLKQAKVQFEQSEALRPDGAGRASRRAGFDIEAVKAMAGVDASLRASGAVEAANLRSEAVASAGKIAAQVAMNQAVLQDTSGAQRLALSREVFAQKQGITGARQAGELALLEKSGAQQAGLLGARQTADLSLDQGRAAQQAALVEGGTATLAGMGQQATQNKLNISAQRGEAARSVANVMDAAAERYSSAAQRSMQYATQGFGTAAQMGAGAAMGSAGLLPGLPKGSEGAGSLGALAMGTGFYTPQMAAALMAKGGGTGKVELPAVDRSIINPASLRDTPNPLASAQPLQVGIEPRRQNLWLE